MDIRKFACTALTAAALGGLLGLGSASAAVTAGQPAPQAATTSPAQQIPATLKALEAAKAGKYGKLRADEKQRLDAAGREIAQLTGSHDDLADLDEQERIQLFNAQETVMGIVADKQRTQLVCTYRAQAGTRFRAKHSVTRDVADAQRQAARENLRGMQNPLCPFGEGGGCMTQMQRVNGQAEVPMPGFGGP
jgi:hypothetical protein